VIGHRRIGFINGPAAHAAARHRLDGFVDSHRGAGLSVDPYLVCQGKFSFESGVECGIDLMTRERRPTAIFAGNDNMAAGVLHAAHNRGLSVSRHLSVVGFDDSPLASQVWPSLTTVRQPIADMAERATQAVIQLSRQGSNENTERQAVVTLPSSVIMRSSSGTVPLP
jgi:LacI family transcriptional regulator